MPGLNRFARRMDVRGRQVTDNMSRAVRRVALAVDQAVVLGTPVDTGYARSNWLVSIGEPREEPLEGPYAPGRKLGKGETKNAQAALAQGQQAIDQQDPGQDIWISNNVDYIGRLNEGSSEQAPAQFVEEAVANGASVVRNVRVFSETV